MPSAVTKIPKNRNTFPPPRGGNFMFLYGKLQAFM
nr:MAG TPA: hypothetical protein [Caudoviricetes sp.]